MKKKTLALVLAFTMTAALFTGCGSKKETETTQPQTETAAETESEEVDDQAAGHGSSLKHPLLANAPSRKLATGMPAARYFFRLFVSGSTTSLQCFQTVALLMPDIRARSENDLPDSLR